MPQMLIPAILLVCGAYCAFAITRPRLRLPWRGMDRPMGTAASAGFALFFVSIGAGLLCTDDASEPPWFLLPAVLGWLLAALGYAADAQAQRRETQVAPMPHTTAEK